MSKKMRTSKAITLMQDITTDILNESLTNELPEGTRDILSHVYEYTPNPNLIHVQDLRTLIKQMPKKPGKLKTFLHITIDMDIPELPQYAREGETIVPRTTQMPLVRQNRWKLWVEFQCKKKQGEAKFKVKFTRRYEPSRGLFLDSFTPNIEYHQTYFRIVNVQDIVNDYKFLYSLKDVILCGITRMKNKKGCDQIVETPGYKIQCGKECFGNMCFQCKQKRLIEYFKFNIHKCTV